MRKIAIFIIFLLALPLWAGVGVEFYGGAGVWSLNLLKGEIEKFARERVDEVLSEDLENDYPELAGAEYEHSETFSSGGGNLAFGIRLYPGGKNGSFSLGFHFMKINMDMVLDGEITAKKGGDHAEVSGSGEVNIDSYAGLLTFQWEFFPSTVVTPYFKLGFGAGTLNGEVSYKGHGTVYIDGSSDTYSQDESKTLEELREEEEGIPEVMPFVNLGLGIRGSLGENLAFYVEGGILNGFYLGGSLGIRF